MKIKGEAEVKWSEVETVKDSTGKDETRDIDYTASEKYFENSFILLASGAGKLLNSLKACYILYKQTNNVI